MAVIEIRLQRLEQLYDSLNPSPFREKALDRHAEDYLVESVMELARNEPLNLRIHLPETLHGLVGAVEQSIHAHFRLKHSQAQRQHRHRMRVGRVALLIGLVVLVSCLLLRGALGAAIDGPARPVLEEGLLILGWVAMWRPVEILLFERWESRHDRRMLDRLARIPVAFEFHDTTAAAVE
jgi:hypothetical protein